MDILEKTIEEFKQKYQREYIELSAEPDDDMTVYQSKFGGVPGDGFGELTDDFHIQACGQALLAKLGDAFVIRDEDKQSTVTLVRQK